MSVPSVHRYQGPKLLFDRAFTQSECFSDTGGTEAAKCPHTSPFHFKSVPRPFPKKLAPYVLENDESGSPPYSIPPISPRLFRDPNAGWCEFNVTSGRKSR